MGCLESGVVFSTVDSLPISCYDIALKVSILCRRAGQSEATFLARYLYLCFSQGSFIITLSLEFDKGLGESDECLGKRKVRPTV